MSDTDQGRGNHGSVPRVSILLPTRDATETLSDCLRSVARQDEARWECVIVDDGSTDDTIEIARGFAATDDRFRIFPRTHHGLVPTLNAGIGHCRASLIARIDADDLMHRRRLAEQRRALESDPSLAAVGCHVRLFPRSALKQGARAYERWLNGIGGPDDVQTEAFVECPIAHPSLMIRTHVLRDLRYREMGWPEDYDLVLRLLARSDRIGIVTHRLLAWRYHGRKLSLIDPTYGDDRFIRCKAAFLATSFLAEHERYILWGHGGTGRAMRRELRSLGKSPAQIVEVHPRRVGNRIDGAEVIPIDQLPLVPRLPIIVSVAGEVARSRIRLALRQMGFVESVDYVCTA